MAKRKLTNKQKERKNELSISELLSNVTSGDLKTIVDKVGWLLNHFPSARNSDVTCLIKFWQTFEPDIISNGFIKITDLYNHAKLTSVVRARAKIQNEYKIFLASPEVQKHRGTLEEDYRDWAVDEKEDCGQYSIYVDESGKTSDYLVVGSIWIIDALSTMTLYRKIMELKEAEQYDQEFHFTSINDGREHTYIKLIDLVYEFSSALSIKFNYIPKEGLNIQDALFAMMYHLIIDGIKHECDTGRAPLPRTIEFVKDQENKGTDALQLKALKETVELASKNIFNGKLYLNEFRSFDSKGNYYLQIADLLVSSINRKLAYHDQIKNSKDRVADYLFTKFDLNLTNGRITSSGDLSSEMII